MKIPDLFKIVGKEVIPMEYFDAPSPDLEHCFREAGHDPSDVYNIIITDHSLPVSDIYVSKKTLEPFMVFARHGATPTYDDCEKALRAVDWKLEIKLQELSKRS